ncbi:MAG: restriction endonuclease subunit S [Pseudomonadota bacterium]
MNNLASKASGWREVHLEDLTDQDSPICYGIVLPGDHIAEGVPVIKVKDIAQGGVRTTALLRTSPDIDAKYKRSRLTGGDILLSIRGTVGRLGIVPDELAGANITQDTARIRISCSETRAYVYQTLQSEDLQTQIRDHVVGQAVKGINIRDVKRLKLLLPSDRRAQKYIAELLSTQDIAIRKTEQLIAAKERQYTATSSQLLFGKARFKKFGSSTLKSLHWFSISSDWSVVEIGEIAREVSAVNKSTDALPVLSCTKYDGLVDSLQYFNKQVFSHNTEKYKLVRHGQFAYATNHIEEGSIGYQDFVPAGLVSPIYTVFQADSSRIHDGYLYKLLKTEKLRQLFAASTNASVDRRGSLRWKEFARIHIPLPSLEEQLSISNFLDSAKQEIDLLRAEVAAIRTQKRGLMQKLLTGQWRLPVPMAVNL